MLTSTLVVTVSWLLLNVKPSAASPFFVTETPSLANRAAASSTVSGGATVQTPLQRIFLDTDTCTEPQQSAVKQAWSDAGLLALAAAGGR